MRRLLLLLPLLLGAAPQAAFRLQQALPDTTLLFAEAPSASAFREAFKKTRLHAFFQDEEIRPLLEGALEGVVKDFRRDFEKELGLPLDRAWELPTGQAAFALVSIGPDGDLFQPDVVLSLDCAGKRETLLKLVAFARKAYEKQAGKKAEVFKAGDDEVVSGELLDRSFRWYATVLNDTLLVATRKATVESLLTAVRKGQPKPLSSAPNYAKALEKSGSRELFLYADVAGFVKAAEAGLPDEQKKVVRALGLQGFTYAAGGVSIGDGRSVKERFFLGTAGEKKGLARFLSLKGPAAGFEAAPADALHFVSFSVDASELYDTVLETVKSADEFEHQRMLERIEQFEKEAEISLKKDLFPCFGPRAWTYTAFPREGLLPDDITTLEVKDEARFEKCLKAALKGLQAKLGEIDFEGKKIGYLKFEVPPGGFDPVRMFLSRVYFARDGDRLHVSGLSLSGGGPNALKRHILRQAKPSLATSPVLKEWLGAKTEGSGMVVYVDLGRIFTTLYNTATPFLVAFAGMFGGAAATGTDVMRLPLGETVGKYLGQSVHLASVEPDGLRVDGISASGTTLMTTVYAGAATIVLLPAIRKAREASKDSGCTAQCSTVYFAVFTHRNEKQKFPDQTGPGFLKQLRDAGYLGVDPVCPHSGKASWRGPAKDVNQMGDDDVIFCDDPANHPDGSINVLRKNGAMERLVPDHPGYRKALETTKGNE